MGAVEPSLVSVLMALQTIIVHHERARGNEISGSRPCQGWMKIIRALVRADDVPLTWILRVKKDHRSDDDCNDRSPAKSDSPFDARSGQTMQHVKPHDEKWRDYVRPIGCRANGRILDFKS